MFTPPTPEAIMITVAPNHNNMTSATQGNWCNANITHVMQHIKKHTMFCHVQVRLSPRQDTISWTRIGRQRWGERKSEVRRLSTVQNAASSAERSSPRQKSGRNSSFTAPAIVSSSTTPLTRLSMRRVMGHTALEAANEMGCKRNTNSVLFISTNQICGKVQYVNCICTCLMARPCTGARKIGL